MCNFSCGCKRWMGLALLLGLVSAEGPRAFAHETDNFCLPLDVEMADLGDYLCAVHTRAIEIAVKEVNVEIERALAQKNPARRARQLERCHDPDAIATAVARQFGAVLAETGCVESAVESAWAKRAYPGKLTDHPGIKMNLVGHLPIDPRALFMLSQAATLKAYGVYFGADKLTHFHHVAWSYYRCYRSHLREGNSAAEAYRKTLHRYSDTDLLAEKNIYGTLGTGIFSNGDMAANHLGFKFLLNLTQPVELKGQTREPLVVRCGVFWRVNDHVRPQSGWFAAFLSDHLNEALNPSLYDATMRAGIRRVLRERAEPIVQFYTAKDGRPRDPAYFEKLARDLSTYYGESYGHSGEFEKLMNIGNTCFPALRPKAEKSASH
jgi:hypothetical protein